MANPGRPPKGLFEGHNFMTPDIVCYYRLAKGWAELSTGTGMRHQEIFGVTVKPDEANVLSRLFQSRADAMAFIELLT